MSGLITRERVLQEGAGQCQHCRQKVTTVLVVNHAKGCREWYPVHPQGTNFVVHECPKAPTIGPMKAVA